MSDWINDTKRQQEQNRGDRQQYEKRLGDLGRVFFTELGHEIAEDVEKVNQAYPHVFNRHTNDHLKFNDGIVGRIEVRIGPTTVLEVGHMQGSHSLEVTRLYPKDARGRNKKATEHYHLKVDSLDNLYLETKDGRRIPRENASQEILGYLIEPL